MPKMLTLTVGYGTMIIVKMVGMIKDLLHRSIWAMVRAPGQGDPKRRQKRELPKKWQRWMKN